MVWAGNGSLSSLEVALSQADNLDDFLIDRSTKENYKNKLFNYLDQESFGCQRFDHVISELKKLSQNVPGFSKRIFEKQKNLIHVPIVEMTPPRFDRAKGQGRAIPATPKQTWVFRSSARKLHGVWWDPSKQNCNPAQCVGSAINAPLRWAGALRDSHLFVLESGGDYKGSAISVVPVRHNSKTYQLVTLMGQAQLTKPRYFHHRGKVTRSTLWQIWADSVGKEFPDIIHVKRDDKGVLSAYQGKKRIGLASDFQPRDPIAKMIAQNAPRKCSAPGKMATANSLLFEGQNIGGGGSGEGEAEGGFPEVTTTTTAMLEEAPVFSNTASPASPFANSSPLDTTSLSTGKPASTPLTTAIEKLVDSIIPQNRDNHPAVSEFNSFKPEINLPGSGSNNQSPNVASRARNGGNQPNQTSGHTEGPNQIDSPQIKSLNPSDTAKLPRSSNPDRGLSGLPLTSGIEAPDRPVLGGNNTPIDPTKGTASDQTSVGSPHNHTPGGTTDNQTPAGGAPDVPFSVEATARKWADPNSKWDTNQLRDIFFEKQEEYPENLTNRARIIEAIENEVVKQKSCLGKGLEEKAQHMRESDDEI